MKVFLAACLAAIVLAAISAIVLNQTHLIDALTDQLTRAGIILDEQDRTFAPQQTVHQRTHSPHQYCCCLLACCLHSASIPLAPWKSHRGANSFRIQTRSPQLKVQRSFEENLAPVTPPGLFSALCG
jgi:hypothetical protein